MGHILSISCTSCDRKVFAELGSFCLAFWPLLAKGSLSESESPAAIGEEEEKLLPYLIPPRNLFLVALSTSFWHTRPDI